MTHGATNRRIVRAEPSLARDNLRVGRLEEFGKLGPVDVVRLDSYREPSAVSVMWRSSESAVLKECLTLDRITQEVDGPAGPVPP